MGLSMRGRRHLQGFRTSSDGLEDRASINIALRVPLGLELSTVKRAAETWRGAARLDFHSSYPPIRVGKNTPPVRALLRAIRAEGGKPRFKLKTGTSDMNLLGPAWGCPIVAYGPGDSALDHTPDEHIDLDEFRRAVGVLARTLEILCVESDQATTEIACGQLVHEALVQPLTHLWHLSIPRSHQVESTARSLDDLPLDSAAQEARHPVRCWLEPDEC